ncbi:MAG: hypothetical protein ACPG5B_03550 [Chitinophagales bacterium]
MQLHLVENSTKTQKLGLIVEVSKSELPFKKDGWKFNWRQLYKMPNARCYKLVAAESPHIIEGLLMLQNDGDVMIMRNIEKAAHNFGKNRRYTNVADCLIAFACKESFQNGKGNYKGWLIFDSKTELIELYRQKYGAEIAMGHKMFIAPNVGRQLIQKHLNKI